MRLINDFNLSDVPTWKIVACTTSDQDYEMDRTMLAENYPDYGDYTIIHGGHCSCYDFNDTSWDATVYTEDELRKVAREWRDNSWWSEFTIAPLILRYIGDK